MLVEKWQLEFTIFNVKLQQASKHMNKSIICANLNIYRSDCL